MNNSREKSSNGRDDDDAKLLQSYKTISDNSYNSYTYSKGSSKGITSMNKLEQEYNNVMKGDLA